MIPMCPNIEVWDGKRMPLGHLRSGRYRRTSVKGSRYQSYKNAYISDLSPFPLKHNDNMEAFAMIAAPDARIRICRSERGQVDGWP